MSQNNNVGGVVTSGPTLLTILFIGLKLTDNIDWSWWWVLSPTWITAIFSFIILFLYGIAVASKR